VMNERKFRQRFDAGDHPVRGDEHPHSHVSLAQSCPQSARRTGRTAPTVERWHVRAAQSSTLCLESGKKTVAQHQIAQAAFLRHCRSNRRARRRRSDGRLRRSGRSPWDRGCHFYHAMSGTGDRHHFRSGRARVIAGPRGGGAHAMREIEVPVRLATGN
jgi:hypothetical protein